MTNAHDQSTNRQIIQAVNRVLQEGTSAALATVVEAPANVGAKLLIEASGERTGGLGEPTLDDAVIQQAATFLESRQDSRTYPFPNVIAGTNAAVRVMFERIGAEPHLVICGAGHVGAVLARLAPLVGYRTTLIDDRAAFLIRERFPDERVSLVLADNWGSAVIEAIGNGHGVSVAVVTRGHNEDEVCIRAALSVDADYIGMIGSKRRTNIVIERLRKAGIDERRLSDIRAPIGLDIGAVSPEEVALAILAEAVAERRGGSGAPLSAWRRKGNRESKSAGRITN